ncbi:hypothetical protein FJT64_016396 [Amphibalanus amphitrite]|uniref:Uncharacterized protein n=1 Tax=Amphibalanus amphitrite TaxID=1232801 RepID=A0A6A4X654_AMPAM|nr:hypothetical protein FJT64_016396 [Amphibalanus amphitrite]
MDTSMDTDCADADSDDSTDTVVASCEMRRRWRERRQDHGTEARKLGRRIKQERFDAAENLSASQTEDAPAPQPEMFSRSDHAPADPPNWSETFAKRPIKVEPSFVPLYKRLAEKYQLVFKNSARLPDTVRKRMPSSDQWQEICSKRLKCELFTGFGIYLEEVADLQDEFLPLNPFRINLRPLKDGPAAGSEEGTPVADPMKPSLTPENQYT